MFQVLGQLVTVDETQAIKDKGDKIDMRFNTTKKYDLQFFLFIMIKLLVL